MIRILFLLITLGFTQSAIAVATSQNPSTGFTIPSTPHASSSKAHITTHHSSQQKSANNCPAHCHEEIALRNQLIDIKYKIQEVKHALQELKQGKTATHMPGVKSPHVLDHPGGGSCHYDCKNLVSLRMSVEKAKDELVTITKDYHQIEGDMAHKKAAAHAANPGGSTHPGAKTNTCPRNCHEAVVELHKIHDLRIQIEQAKHAQNPKYTMRPINNPAVQDKVEHCQADCAQIRGLQREIQKYEAELTKVKSTHITAPSPSGHSTALVLHQPQHVGASSISPPKLSPSDVAALTHPKELCPNVGQMLKRILAVEQQIHDLNPQYKIHTAPVDLSQFRQESCSAEDPNVMHLRQIQGTLKLYLEDLQRHGHSGTAIAGPSQPLVLSAPHSENSSALIPHRSGSTAMVPQNKNSGTAIAGPSQQLALSAPHSKNSTALVPHRSGSSTCPKNCHEAWTELQEVYQLRQEIEQAKHARNPHYTMKQINPPTMQNSGQHCQADCGQVKGIQRQVDQYKAELAHLTTLSQQTEVSSNTALVPHNGTDMKSGHTTQPKLNACPTNCHEVWEGLQEVYQLRQQIEQAKQDHNPNYTMRQINEPTMQESDQHCHERCRQVLGVQREIQKYQAELTRLENMPVSIGQKPGFLGKIKSGLSSAKNRIGGKFSGNSSNNNYSNNGVFGSDPNWDLDNQNNYGNNNYGNNGYNPYGTNDDLNYNNGYGYNNQTGNYNQGYGYNNQIGNYNQGDMQGYDQYGNPINPYGQNPYGGGSSVTHEESGAMYPGYSQQGGDIATSNTDGENPGANAGAAAITAFGSVLKGLLQQPAAVAPATPAPQPTTPTPQSQAVTPYGQSSKLQDVTPQNGDDFDALYGGSGGDYAPAGSGSSYGGTSSSYGSGGNYTSPSIGSSYNNSSGSYGSGYGNNYKNSNPTYDDYGY